MFTGITNHDYNSLIKCSVCSIIGIVGKYVVKQPIYLYALIVKEVKSVMKSVRLYHILNF
jgi:hypothetical protein